jgi:glutaredoxin
MQEKVRLVLYTKPGCGLCEEMKTEMKTAGVGHLYTLEEVNIENDAELFAQYRYDIPVLLNNGVEGFRHRVSADEFRHYVGSLLRTN